MIYAIHKHPFNIDSLDGSSNRAATPKSFPLYIIAFSGREKNLPMWCLLLMPTRFFCICLSKYVEAYAW